MNTQSKTRQPKQAQNPKRKRQPTPPNRFPLEAIMFQRANADPTGLTPTDVLHLQRTVGNRAVQRLLDDTHLTGRIKATQGDALWPPVQRWELSTPLKGQGAHETLTLEALKKVYPEIFEQAQSYKDAPAAWEYIRGALWNDDPAMSLFWTRKTRGLGLEFVGRFLKGEHSTKSLGPQGSLTGRSHVGDLQFLHGMADPTETTLQTKEKVMTWAEFTYKVATGTISADTKLGDVPVAGIPALFPKQANWTVKKLFGVSNRKSNVRHRATGSLLHMLQDTFCESHSARTKDERNEKLKGKITGFRAYGSQVGGKHALEDQLVRDVKAKNSKLKRIARSGQMEELIAQVPGAQQAVQLGAAVLTFIKDGAPWDSDLVYQNRLYPKGVKEYFDTEIFGLEEGVEQQTAGPGQPFRKPFEAIRKEFKRNTSIGRFKKRHPRLKQIDLDLKICEMMEKAQEEPQFRKQRLERTIDTKIIPLLEDNVFEKKPGIVRELQVLRSILQEMARDLAEEIND